MKSFSFDIKNRKSYNSIDQKAYKTWSNEDEFWDDFWEEDNIIIDTIYPGATLIYNSCCFTAYNKKVLNKFKMSSKYFKKIASFGKIPGVRHNSW